eukprot:3565007-Amphidinium_carterae.1
MLRLHSSRRRSSSSGDQAQIRDLLDLEVAHVQEAEKPLPTPVPAVNTPPIAKSPPPTIGPRESVPETPPALPLIATPISRRKEANAI